MPNTGQEDCVAHTGEVVSKIILPRVLAGLTSKVFGVRAKHENGSYLDHQSALMGRTEACNDRVSRCHDHLSGSPGKGRYAPRFVITDTDAFYKHTHTQTEKQPPGQ